MTRVVDRHGKVRWRYRRRGLSTYLPGAYGSPEWRAAYEAAEAGAKEPVRSRAAHGSIAWLIEQYLGSIKFQNASPAWQKTLRSRLDWIREVAGKYPYARMEVRHVEAIMAKKAGPAAANNVRKALGLLFRYAAAKLGYKGSNPAVGADRMKGNREGFHTWTDDEIDQYLKRHGPGTKARLAILLALNTGMARQDLARVGWQHVQGGRIRYQRGKTGVVADVPILPDLAVELANVPATQMLFIVRGDTAGHFTAEGLGNWFRRRCREACVPGSIHGLRKAGATRLANASASDWEIASYLAHENTSQAAIYTRKANRSRLADSGFAKLKTATSMSNPTQRLGKKSENDE